MKLNSPIVTNIIMLGALAHSSAIPVSMEDIKSEIEKSFPSNKVELNLKALNMGFNAVQ